MNRMNLMNVAAVLALTLIAMVGCEQNNDGQQNTAPALEATSADFEAEAQATIDASNVDEELESLEAQIEADDSQVVEP